LAVAIFLVTILVLVVATFHTYAYLTVSLVMIAAVSLSTAVHELGHAVAAVAVRWRVVVFSVHWVALHLPNRRIVFDRRLVTDDVGGWVLAVPRSARVDSRRRYLIFCLGGPLASLVLCLAAGLSLEVIDNEATLLGLPTGAALFAVMSCSFCSLILSSVPNQKGNDGDQIARLLADWSQPDHNNALGWLELMLYYKVRLRDAPEWMLGIYRQEAELDPEVARSLLSFESAQALDMQKVDVALARHKLDEYRSKYGGNDWNHLCTAWLYAVHDRDLAAAEAMLSAVPTPSELPRMHYAALAAVAMLKGDSGDAALNLRLMAAELKASSPFPDMTFRDIRLQALAVQPLPSDPAGL
jgi:hypothetical protein